MFDKRAQGVEGLTSANTWDGVTDATADRYKSEYTYDANGNIETVARHDGDGNMYDAMNYGYHADAHGRKVRNRPYNIQDFAAQDGDYAQDIPQVPYQPNGIVDEQDVGGTINTANNFSYDALGQRIKDKKADIELIEWTAAGKMKRVHHTAASGKPDITFAYDAAGNRILKQVGDPGNGGYREHYLRDAQGNIMAIYRYTNDGTASTKLVERPVYGSKRIGSYTEAQEVAGAGLLPVNYTHPLQAAAERYELTDHLGNVATVVSGRLLPMIGPGIQYQAEVLTAQGYEPFGMALPGRSYQRPLGSPPPPVTPKGTLIITEFSNGPGGDCEYVELYVTGCSLYPEATEVDIRGWIIDDNAGNFNSSGGCSTGQGISAGHLRFADVAAWAAVPVGSVIVLYNGTDNCYGFTAQESGTGGQYFVNVSSTALIERTSLGSGATPNSGGDCGYCGNSYAATGNTAWGSVLSMSNSADALQVRCPDCPDNEAGFFHGVAYGSGFGGLTAGGNDMGGAYVSGPGTGRTYELTGAGAPGDGANWTRSTAPTGGTPPATAGVVDANVAAWLEGASLPCCGSFEAPPVVAKADYRWSFQSQIKDVELNTVHFKYREYSPPYGFFDRTDPLWAKYPYWSPYAFSGNRVIDSREIEGLEPSGINPQTGVQATANDTYSQHGQFDSQLIYPSGGPSGRGSDWGQALEKLYAVDRALSGSTKQFPLRTFDKQRLAGGFKLVDDYAIGTNNADRVGDPSKSLDVTALKARAEASFGPEKLTSRINPAQGEGWVGNVPEAIGSASGAIGAAWDPLSPQESLLGPINRPVFEKIDTFYITGNGDGLYRTAAHPEGEHHKKGDTLNISIQSTDENGNVKVRTLPY